MIQFLFRLPNLLFEPIAAGTVLGLLTALVVCRKKNNRFFWIISGMIFFMLFWRLACHSLMVSTRYASVLLYPAVIATVWFCFYLRENVSRSMKRLSPRNYQFTSIIIAIIPYFLIAGLITACLIKVFHYNPYRAGIMELCNYCIAHKDDSPVYLYHNKKEKGRILFYIGKEMENCFSMLPDTNIDLDQCIKEELRIIQNIPGKHFFILQQPVSEKNLSSADLLEDDSYGSWKALEQIYTSHKKKYKHVLYCYIPAFFPNSEKWDAPIPDYVGGSISCRNGDFETALPEKKQQEHMESLLKNGFIPQPDVAYLFPDAWWQSIENWTHTPAPVIKLVSDNALSGKYSLLIDSEKEAFIRSTFVPSIVFDSRSAGIVNSPIITMKESKLEFFVRNIGQEEAKMHFYIFSGTKPYDTLLYRLFRFQSGQTYKIHFPLSKCFYPDSSSCYLSLRVQGKILIDNVAVFSQGTD